MRRHEVGFAKFVEAMLHMIGRQQTSEIKVYSKEVVQCIGVFGSGESLEGIIRALS